MHADIETKKTSYQQEVLHFYVTSPKAAHHVHTKFED